MQLKSEPPRLAISGHPAFTFSEAAARLGISTRSLSNLVREGKIQVEEISGRYFVTEPVLRRYEASR